METLTQSNWFRKKVNKSEVLPPAELAQDRLYRGETGMVGIRPGLRPPPSGVRSTHTGSVCASERLLNREGALSAPGEGSDTFAQK